MIVKKRYPIFLLIISEAISIYIYIYTVSLSPYIYIYTYIYNGLILLLCMVLVLITLSEREYCIQIFSISTNAYLSIYFNIWIKNIYGLHFTWRTSWNLLTVYVVLWFVLFNLQSLDRVYNKWFGGDNITFYAFPKQSEHSANHSSRQPPRHFTDFCLLDRSRSAACRLCFPFRTHEQNMKQ